MVRTDVQLMLDVKAGDGTSFELLLQRYRTPLVNFLDRMVRNREQAEDLAQEVFLRVYRAREDYGPSAKFTTWLFRIATNLLRDHWRRPRHTSIDELPEDRFALAGATGQSDSGIVLGPALQQLRPRARQLLWLAYAEGYSHAEIAAAFGRSVSFSKSQLARAHLKLRAWFEPQGSRPTCTLS